MVVKHCGLEALAAVRTLDCYRHIYHFLAHFKQFEVSRVQLIFGLRFGVNLPGHVFEISRLSPLNQIFLVELVA